MLLTVTDMARGKICVLYSLVLVLASLLALGNNIEDFGYVTVPTYIEKFMTAAEQQNEEEAPAESEVTSEESAFTVTSLIASVETPSMANENRKQGSMFNMWLHMQQGYSKQKVKEKFCMSKMEECLADPKSGHDDPQTPDPGTSWPDVTQEYSSSSGSTISYASTVSQRGMTEETTSHVPTHEAEVSDGGNILQGESASQTAEDHKCNLENFMRLRECCPHLPGDLIQGAIIYACAEGSAVVPRALLREYSMNLGQTSDRSINLTSTKTFSGQLLGGSVCFIDCVFKKRVLVTPEENIDYAMVRHHFGKAVSGAWSLAMLQAIETCGRAIKYVHPERRMYRSSYEYCLVHPFLLVQCIRKSLILSCTAMNIQENHPECKRKLDKLKLCDIFKIPPT